MTAVLHYLPTPSPRRAANAQIPQLTTEDNGDHMTQQATLTAKYVNGVKAGKKFATIKDQGDEMWLVEPGLIGSFRPNSATTVEYETIKFGDGTERKKITGIIHGAAPQTNGAAAPQHESSPGKDRLIFVTGVVGRAMGSGKFAIAELSALTGAAIMAWELVNAPESTPAKPHAEFNDSVPF